MELMCLLQVCTYIPVLFYRLTFAIMYPGISLIQQRLNNIEDSLQPGKLGDLVPTKKENFYKYHVILHLKLKKMNVE